MSNVIALNSERRNFEQKELLHVTERVFSSHPTGAAVGHQRTAAAAAFLQQSRGRTLVLRYVYSSPAEKPLVTVALEASSKFDDSTAYHSALRDDLDVWVNFLWPGAKCDERIPPLPFTNRRPIVPRGHDHWPISGHSVVLVEANSGRPLLEDIPQRQLDLIAALTFLRAYAPAELTIRLKPFRADAHDHRCLSDLIKDAIQRGDCTLMDEARSEFLQRLNRSGNALRISFEIAFGNSNVHPIVRDLLCYKLLGCSSDPEGFSELQTDLRCLWPLGYALPSLLVEMPAVDRAAHSDQVDTNVPGSLSLGHLAKDDDPIGLGAADRARHLLVMGGTGTGKSTLLHNMMLQDMKGGGGLILIDPHGDLADEAKRAVPASRRNDVVWSDFSDPETILGVNILEMTGLDPGIERSILANQLTNFFRTILYRDVDAFGPIFDQYFRSGLMLLMSGAGNDASLVDFERVFYDRTFRNCLLAKCGDAKLREFWEEIAGKVGDSADHSLANMTPYITSKLAQLTGNPLVRRFITPKRSSLDLRKAMDSGQIVLIKLAKGIIGEYDTKLIATLLSMRIMQVGMARASVPLEQRRPCRFYFDEYQNSHGQPIAAILAETRKYGIAVTLANQSLGQVTGRAGNDDAGNAALANAANLILFRLGAIDAAHVAPWLQPEISWQELMRLPDYHAVARVLSEGRPMPPRIFRSLPPPALEECSRS